MSNATGFMADKRGAHGPKAELADLCSVLSLKENGGILNSYKTVEYVDGIADVYKRQVQQHICLIVIFLQAV